MTRIITQTTFKKMWQGPHKLHKGLKPYELKICRLCNKDKATIEFDGMGASGICKDCANQRSKDNREKKAKEWCFEKPCRVCNKPFIPYGRSQKVCSITCRHKRNQIVKQDNPMQYRAICLTSTVVGLKNKRVIVEEMLNQALGKKCPYCGIILVLPECSLDHKIPLMRNNSLTHERKVLLNQVENLHIICRRCNGLKAEFSHDEYLKLLKFTKENPTIGEKLFRRLARAAIMWKFKKQ